MADSATAAFAAADQQALCLAVERAEAAAAAARRYDTREGRGDPALTPLVVQTATDRARDSMLSEPDLRDDPRGCATASFMLVPHRLMRLETNRTDRTP